MSVTIGFGGSADGDEGPAANRSEARLPVSFFTIEFSGGH